MKPIRIFLFFFLLLLFLIAGYALLPPCVTFPGKNSLKNPFRPYFMQAGRKSWNQLMPNIPLLKDSIDNTLHFRTTGMRRLLFTDSLLQNVPPLEYTDSVSEKWEALIRYYQELQKRDLTTHILYYGDSQIEGDRITWQLRDSLQKWFGGGGPGLFLPVMTVPVTSTLRIEADHVWKKEACDLIPKTGIMFPSSGLFTEHVFFVPDTGNVKTSGTEASFRVTFQSFAPPGAKRVNKYRIFCRGYGPVVLVIRSGDEKITRTLNPSGTFQEISGNLYGNPREISFRVKTSEPFIIEAISLEKNPGIVVDNIPLRGRTMVSFSKTDPAILRKMVEDLNVKLIILQFGLNAVAGGGKEVNAFSSRLRHQLSFLRRIVPDVLVLIVGSSDMEMTPGISDSLSSQLRNIQRQTALQEGCLFWDSFRAMGGSGSAQKWAENNPSLMRPDHVHFSMEGSRLFSMMLIKTLRHEFDYQTEADTKVSLK